MSLATPTAGYPPARAAFALAWPAPRRLATGLWFAFVLFSAANLSGLGVESAGSSLHWAMRSVLCIAAGGYGLFYFRQTWLDLNRFPYAWAFLFAIWATTSALVTGRLFGVAASVTLWCQLLFVPIALRQMGGRRAIITSLYALQLFLLGCWLAHLLIPAYREWEPNGTGGFRNRLGGLAHPNDVGCNAALITGLLLLAGNQGLIRWRYLLPGLMLCLASLGYAASRTALISVVPVAMLVVYRTFGRKPLLLAGFGVLLTLVTLAFAAESLGLGITPDRWAAGLSRSGDADEIYSFTGRLDVWKFAITKIQESPVCGVGFGCVRFAMEEMNGWTPGHAHNLLLNMTMATGLVGGLLLSTMLLTQIVQCFRRPDLFPDLLIILIGCNGLAESLIFNHIPDALTLLFLMSLVWRQQSATLSESNWQTEEA